MNTRTNLWTGSPRKPLGPVNTASEFNKIMAGLIIASKCAVAIQGEVAQLEGEILFIKAYVGLFATVWGLERKQLECEQNGESASSGLCSQTRQEYFAKWWASAEAVTERAEYSEH